MKKIYSFMVAAVALFAAASCNKELPQEEVPAVGETVVYTASTDGADTKAALNETTKKSEWVADDAITVHDGEKGWTFTAAEAGANVDFSNSEGFGEYRPVLAVYPAGTYTVDVAAKTAKAYIPTWQQAQAGTYHSLAALAVAYTEDNTFAFKNAHALLKFTVNTDNVTHVIFHGNGSEAITGDVNVTLGEDGVESVECLETVFTSEKWNEETQQKEQVSETKYGTWVECYAYHDDANKYFAKDRTYYIAVAPQKFEGGVTVRVRINDGEELVAKTTTNPVETKINTILNLGEIKYEAPATVEKVYLQPGVWSADDAWFSAHFFNSVGGAEDVKMTDEDADGVYEVSVPAGMESVIFCRMNPAYSDFAWNNETETDHVWTEMSSVAIPLADDTKVYYNVTDWEAGEWSDTPQENTPDQPEVVEKEWGIVGTMTDWSDNIPMTLVDGWYVAENVTIKTSDEFKFRVGTTWDELKTYNLTTIVANTEYTTVDGQGDGNGMKVAVSAIYSVYLSADAATMKVVKTGDLPVESVPDQPSDWALAGTFNNWADKPMVTTKTPDLYVVKNVEFADYAEFKVKKKAEGANNGWGTSYGVKSINYINSNVWFAVQLGSATNISIVNAGTYDIYFDLINVKVYVMAAGEDYSSAIEQTANGKAPVINNARTIYLKAGPWPSDNAWFIAYTWGGASSAAMVKMVESSKGSGIYECEIPNDRTNIIFLRKNPANTSLDWNDEWNRFELTLPSDKNCFTVTNSWENGGWSNI